MSEIVFSNSILICCWHSVKFFVEHTNQAFPLFYFFKTKFMQRMIGLSLFLAITIFAVSSCSKDPLNNMTEEESRIYITNHDSTVNFSSYKTYSIVDSVALVDNNRLAGKEATS